MGLLVNNELADKKHWIIQVWLTEEHRGGNEMVLVCTRDSWKAQVMVMMPTHFLRLYFTLCHPSRQSCFVKQSGVEQLPRNDKLLIFLYR